MRPGLFAVLAGAGRVTQISAGAGSGKTLLVRTWIAEANLSDDAAWVSVGRDEHDAERFWLSVLDAVRATRPGSALVGALTAAPDLDVWNIVDGLLKDLRPLAQPLWLVLDDVQELAGRDTLEQLSRLVADAPPPMRLILLTRVDLPLGLHRLRLQGELTELRGADLRFSREEARALIEATGTRLSDAALDALVARTEGWAAGLRLAALSLVHHPDPERFAAEFSGSERTVAEYLLAEVLDRQPAEVTRLLLRTSILERVSGPLADRLTGGTGAQRILTELEDEQAFVVSLDPQRTWFRYHNLFADLLALELRRQSGDELQALHATASEWLAANGHPVEAVRHALAAEDWTQGARLLAESFYSLYLDGRATTTRELLALFPSGTATADPELAAVAAIDQLTMGSLDAAERYLTLADRGAPSLPSERRERLEVYVAAMRLSLARRRMDLDGVAAFAERLLVPAEGGTAHVALSDDLRTLTLHELGITNIWTGQLEEAERHLNMAVTLARRIDRPVFELGALAYSGLAAALRGTGTADEAELQAFALARANGWEDKPFVGVVYTVLGSSMLWQGRLEEADVWLKRGEQAVLPEVEPAVAVMFHGSRGLLELVRGRVDEALSEFAAAEAVHALLPTHVLAARVRVHRLLAQIRAGHWEAVEPALDGSAEMAIVAAALALARDDADTAAELLAGVEPSRTEAPMSALLLSALADDARGDAGAASRALERALDLGERSGLLLPFLLFPAPDLLERHARARTAHAALVAELLDLLAGQAGAGRPRDVEPLRDPLSESELRVLRYLPTNLHATEIASELFVSENTIRTHMRHLYAKLGVHRRADAVQRGRDLGLLATSSRRR
ncbi:LuxR C-terminal-related transcriptional regulator [Solirubrobacter ginsenosidimutans]|uniref:LuxR C-terminal-related transcriptional regulator n=1 Tax=Solirubrobacter ginsenosidimutans TaxID=490573 RepID=A0A9X3MZ74_9ACTN|nr:LuxR C-terminal-related transcriptional regulator [Solirubrobacter ginsenosidimutans]